MAGSWKTRSPSAALLDLSLAAVTLDVGRHSDQRQSFDQHTATQLRADNSERSFACFPQVFGSVARDW